MTRLLLFATLCLAVKTETTKPALVVARSGAFICSLELGICQSEGGSAQQCEAQYKMCRY